MQERVRSNRAMTLADARLQTNPDDIQALYAKGVSYGLRSNYHFLVRKAYSDALRDATAARKAHYRVTEIDPNCRRTAGSRASTITCWAACRPRGVCSDSSPGSAATANAASKP